MKRIERLRWWRESDERRRSLRGPTGLVAAVALALPLAAAPALAQDYGYDETEWSDYEYNPREGLHEEEWYDPGDWFDADDGIDYDDDWWAYDGPHDGWDTDYGYGYDYGYDEGWYDNAYDSDYGHDWYDDSYGYDDTAWEYEPGEGLHEEEWYDPSDWFDDDSTIDYENGYAYGGYGYDDDWYDYDYGVGYDWHDDYDAYDYGDQDWSYGYHYEWDPVAEEWDREYGWYEDYYDYGYGAGTGSGTAATPDLDYGYYYSWNPVAQEWEREYGYHYRDYAYNQGQRRQGQQMARQGQQSQRMDQQRRTQQQRGQQRTAQQQRRDQQRTEQQQRRDPQRMGQQRQRGQQQRQQGRTGERMTQFSGTVQDFKRVQVMDQGRGGQHTFVRLRLQDGSTRVIDLGPHVSLSELDLSSGARIQVRGIRDQVNGQTVLKAASIRVDGERTRTKRDEAMPQQQRQQAMRGQQRGQQQQAMRPQQQRQQAMRQQHRMDSVVAVAGRIDGFKKVNLQGAPDSHTLVRLRLQDGSRAVVNLGPRVEPRDLGLKGADRVRVRGVRTRIDGQPVVLADSVRVDGQPTDIRHDFAQLRGRQHQQASRQGTGSQQATLQGSLAGFKRVELEGQRDAHTLVRVRLEDGTSRVVNLGPNVSPSDLNLDEANRVRVRGTVGTIDGQRVLMASQFRVDGDTTRIRGTSR